MSTAELKEMIADLYRSQKEITAQMKENREQMKDTDARMKDTDARMKDTDARMKDTDTQMKETKKFIKELGKQIGGIGEKFGSFTEGLAYPSMTKVLYKKFKIDNTVANYLRRLPSGKCVEYDAFGYTNGSVNNAVVVEIKSHLQHRHIADFVQKLIDFPKIMPPEFHNKHLYGIICTVKNVSSELRQHAEESGIYIATVHDDIFKLHENKAARDFKKTRKK